MTEPSPYGPPGERDQTTSPPVPPGVAPDITLTGFLPNATGSVPHATGPVPHAAAMPVTPGRSHRPPPDRRVWPPLDQEKLDQEDEDRATQPFPALRGLPISAAPYRFGSPPGAAGPAVPHSPAPIGPGPTAEHVLTPAPVDFPADPAVGPGTSAGPIAALAPLEGNPSAHPPVSAGRTHGGRRRTVFGLAAAMLLVLAGASGWFGYRVIIQGSSNSVQLVPPGKAGVAHHVAWQASLQEIPDPSGQPDTADRQWMKIVLTRTALDTEGAIRHSAPKVTLTDRSGRQWPTSKVSDDTPPAARDNTVGVPYRMELVAEIPSSIVDEVEILLRPSSHRDVPDWSVREMVQALVASMEPQDQVLRFQR